MSMGGTKQKQSKQRRTRGQAEALPTFIQGACEFSDDPHGLDNTLWVVRAIKRELIGQAGPLGNAWQELRDHLDAVCQKKEGARRIKGAFLLLANRWCDGAASSGIPERASLTDALTLDRPDNPESVVGRH